jgi:preprotein translocase subunit SecD
MRARCWTILLLCSVQACSTKQAAVPRTEPALANSEVVSEQPNSQRSIELVYVIEGEGLTPEERRKALHAVVETMRNRLAALKLREPSLVLQGERIVVQLADVPADDVGPIRQGLEKRATLGMHAVIAGSDFAEALHQHAKEDSAARKLGIQVDEESWTGASDGAKRRDYFVCLDDKARDAPAVLRSFVEQVTRAHPELRPEPERMVRYGLDPLSETKRWRSYYLERKAALDESAIASAQVKWDPNTNMPLVLVDFSPGGAATLAAFTKEQLGEKVAMIVDDEVSLAAIVMAPITGGSLSIQLDRTDPNRALSEAEGLAASLRAASMPATLRLESWRDLAEGG